VLDQEHQLAKYLREIAPVYLVDDEDVRSFTVDPGTLTKLKKRPIFENEPTGAIGPIARTVAVTITLPY
jgi:hypothetical protein